MPATDSPPRHDDALGPEPEVSVILLTFHRPGPLRRCLDSLVRQTLPAGGFEVVEVDSSDPPMTELTAEFAKSLPIRHLPGVNLGVAGNRNRGVAAARGRWLAFIDDDCVARPDWLEKLLECARAHPECLIGGRVENLHPTGAVAAAGQAITEAVDAFYNPPGEAPRFVPGLNFAVPRRPYLELGGSDSGFGTLAAEDRDFVDRWRVSGRALVVCPEAILRHEHRTSLRGFARQYFNYGRGAWRYHRLRRERGSGWISQDIQLHRHWWRYFRGPLGRLPSGIRLKVLALLALWQLANLAGFVWQAVHEAWHRPPS